MIVAHNLARLIDRKYPRERSRTAQYKRFAHDAETTLSQIQRAVTGTHAIGVDMLERFADVLDVRASDLLIDGAFAERPVIKPPTLRTI